MPTAALNCRKHLNAKGKHDGFKRQKVKATIKSLTHRHQKCCPVDHVVSRRKTDLPSTKILSYYL